MPINPDPDLMRIFDFTAADLEANRAGYLSERQKLLITKSIKGKHPTLIMGGILATAMFFLLMAFTGVFDSSSAMHSQIVLWTLLALSIPVWVILIIYTDHKKISSDIELGKVNFEIGSFKSRSTKGGGAITINKLSFDLDGSEYFSLKKYLKHFPKGTQFRVYYAPKTKKIVSMEIITS